MQAQNIDFNMTDQHSELRVLVAEDNYANQLVAKTLLLRAGYDVTTVDNGYEAVKEAQKQSYDIILMDIEMPGMNGIEATEEIRKAPGLNQKTKIIALTAYGSPSEKYTYRHSGIDATLSKPLRMNRLAEALSASNAAPPSRSFTLPITPQNIVPPSSQNRQDAPQTDYAHLDLITINMLLDAAGRERLLTVIKAYWRSAYALMAEMQTANEMWDRDTLQRSAHALKGASMNIGVLKVSRIAEQLQNTPLEHVPDLLDQLGTTMAQARKALLIHLKSAG